MKVFFSCLVILAVAACNETATHTNPLEKSDQVERIVGTDNWQMVNGQDTSYFYFSPIGNVINVYRYTINKGDSVNTRMNNIVHQSDSVIWNWESEKLLLAGVDSNTINWEAMNVRKDKYKMLKIDSLHISFVFPDGRTAIMKKMLPLSTFLVRKRYDYTHGTSYADSADVKK